MVVHYDNIGYNANMLLDLRFREATGIITNDIAKPHHPITLVNTPSWSTLGSNLGVIEFNGTNEYAQCLAASCADLDFTSGSYSIAGWVKWTDTGLSELVIGRYETEVSGWDCYFDASGGTNTFSQRHHHLSLTPNLKSSCFSIGWTPDTWWHFGISRTTGNVSPLHYRNGVALDMSYEAGGMLDADTSAKDLVIGVRGTTKDANYFDGPMWGLRVTGDALTAEDFMNMYEKEKVWFA